MDYIGREESELEYHARVLARAGHHDLPVLERVKFLAIFTTLTDELFRVRLAGMGEGRGDDDPSETDERLAGLRRRFGELAAHQRSIFDEQVVPDLAASGIRMSEWSDLDDGQRRHFSDEFEREIKPILTPLAVGPAHPFPFISDLSVSIGAILDDGYESRFGRVKVPPSIDRFRIVEASRPGNGVPELVVVPVEEIIGAHLDEIFPGRSVREWASFRVTRNADYDVDDDNVDDLLDAVASELLVRRFQDAVRLEIDPGVSDAMRTLLSTELGVNDDACFVQTCPIGLSDLWELYGLDRPDLKDEMWSPVVPAAFAEKRSGDDLQPESATVTMFATIRDQDVLVQHPYESFVASTQRFLQEAAEDDAVQAIK